MVIGFATLIVALGTYSVFWFVVAGRIEDGFAQWAQSLRADNLDLSWRAIRIDGFPLVLRVELGGARLRDGATPPSGEIEVPRLSGSARLWNFREWQLAAPDGLTATMGPAAKPAVTVTAATATGSVAISAAGGAAAWLGFTAPTAETGVRFAAREAEVWLNLPHHPPLGHSEPAIGVAFDVRGLALPAVPSPLRNPVDEIAFGVTLTGSIPAAPPRRAASAWRDAGGTLELDHVALHWGALGATGSGTVALDSDLQPIGSFSGAIEGYDELMRALVAAGRLRASEARLAGVALNMLAKAGPDGRPRIATSFTIQDGEMYLGSIKIGKAPRIAWP